MADSANLAPSSRHQLAHRAGRPGGGSALDTYAPVAILTIVTPRAISIVRDSFAQLMPIPDRVGGRFYHRLFQLAPETRAMFAEDMTEQRLKLVQTLATVVKHLDRLDPIMPAVHDLAIRHLDYGVQDEQYSLVGLALIETLREMLGTKFDGELEQAWRDAYGLVATAMIDAARAARS